MSWLPRLGVQPRPFRALLRAYLAIDLRAQFYGEATNVGDGEVISPLYWVVGQFLTVSFLLCAAMQARVDATFYAAANLATTAVLIFSAVVVEFHEAAFDPTDVEVVGHRPVSARTWSAARLANLALYVAMMTLSVLIFPTAMGAGLVDAPTAWWLAYPVAAVSTAATAASLALLLYTAAGVGASLELVRRGAAWVQILAILVLFYGGQLMLRNATGSVEYFAARPPEWWGLLPTTWLADGVTLAHPARLGMVVVVAGLAVAVSLGRLSAAWDRVSRVRPVHAAAIYRAPPVPGQLAGGLARLLTRSRREATIFQLASLAMARDGSLTTRNLSTLALPVAAALLGVLTAQYADPLLAAGPESVLPIGTAALLAVAVPTVMQHLTTSSDPTASWRLALAWDGRAAAGARKAVLARFFAPLWLAHAALLAAVWREPVGVLVHTVVGWLLLEVVARASARTLFARPILRRPPRLGGTFGGAPLVLAGASALSSLLAGLWFMAATTPLALAAFALALAAACVVLERP